MGRMGVLKLLCAVGFLAVLASNIWTMSRWSESRGVYDDVCYLRQAHLFERFGLRGIDTNLTFDDDHYLKAKLRRSGFRNGMTQIEFPATPIFRRRTNMCCSIHRVPGSSSRCFPLDFR